jgi:hypothetical protein
MSIGVSPRDVRAIQEAVPHVEVAVPRLAATGKTESSVFGVSHLHLDLMNERVAAVRPREPQEHHRLQRSGEDQDPELPLAGKR